MSLYISSLNIVEPPVSVHAICYVSVIAYGRWSPTRGQATGPIFRVICIWWPHPLVSSYRNLCNNFKQLVQGKKLESMATVLYLTCYIIQRLGQFTWKNLGSFVSLEADTGKIEFRSIIATEKVWHLIQVKRPPDQFEVVRRVELWYVFQKQGFFCHAFYISITCWFFFYASCDRFHFIPINFYVCYVLPST